MTVTKLSRRLFIESVEARARDPWAGRPLEVLSRQTALGRGWRGLNASLVSVAGGVSEPVILARHNVTMLVSSPLETTAVCDSATSNRWHRPGEFDVLPAASSVSWFDGGHSVFLAAGVEHELVCEVAGEMGVDAARLAIAPRFICRDPQIEHLLWALKAELEADQPFGRLYADGIGVALAAQLVRHWTAETKPISGGLSKRTLAHVLEYIAEHLNDDLTLADVAHVADLSPSRFKVLFKQSTGVPVHRFVLRRRAERAAELLLRTREPLCDIALEAGFANQSHMAAIMKKSMGVTPKVLRESR